MVSPPTPLDQSQPNLVCDAVTHMNGAANGNYFAPPPGEGSKGQISLNFNNKIDFKGFYTKLLVFLQIKDMKHI